MAQHNSFRKFLENYQVKDLLPKDFKLIQIEKNSSILEAFKLLRKEKILSLPVWDPETKKYLGLVDTLDILTLLVTLSDLKSIVDIFTKKPNDEETWIQFIEKEKELISQETVDQIINASERNPWCPVYLGLPLLSLIDIFSKDPNIHRVPVIDGDGNVVGLISQSRIIEFLANNTNAFSDVAKKTLDAVSKSWFVGNNLKTVNEKESTLEGFEKIISERVTGLAVVNDKGELIHSLSASDFKRSIDSNLFSDIFLPIGQFLQKENPEFPLRVIKEPITVISENTLKDVLDKLSSHKLHRLFIVQNKKPIRILSLCDVLTVLNQC